MTDWISIGISTVSVIVAIVALLHANSADKKASTAIASIGAGVGTIADAATAWSWELHWRQDDRYEAVNCGPGMAYEVQIRGRLGGNGFTLFPDTYIWEVPRNAAAEFTAVTNAGTEDRMVHISWLPEPDGERLTWHSSLPRKPKP